ncbi:baculoviral IAP repeat-containing protein [Endozoicomonas sp. Mp262]|uniref:baculoviral IAP repeat-containing protein n=1 Tax=Endozoicomonas sp. Mp262 TaxID=2919499 RepID=UPI0021DA7CE4
MTAFKNSPSRQVAHIIVFLFTSLFLFTPNHSHSSINSLLKPGHTHYFSTYRKELYTALYATGISEKHTSAMVWIEQMEYLLHSMESNVLQAELGLKHAVHSRNTELINRVRIHIANTLATLKNNVNNYHASLSVHNHKNQSYPSIQESWVELFHLFELIDDKIPDMGDSDEEISSWLDSKKEDTQRLKKTDFLQGIQSWAEPADQDVIVPSFPFRRGYVKRAIDQAIRFFIKEKTSLPDNWTLSPRMTEIQAFPFLGYTGSQSRNSSIPIVTSAPSQYRSILSNQPPPSNSNLGHQQPLEHCQNRTPSTQHYPEHSGRNGIRYPHYQTMKDRIDSFRNAPNHLNSESMAKAGLFYTGQDDLCRCFNCGIGLKDWNYDNNPILEHYQHSKTCLHIKELYNPRHLEYSTYDIRCSSFTGWPCHVSQTPQQLAEAGFYYTGCSDIVRCFYCDGGCQRWDPEDDPWIEHARWHPGCQFVKIIKGEDYIQLVAASYNQGEAELGEIPTSSNQANAKQPAETKALIEMGYNQEYIDKAIKKLRAKGHDINPATIIDEIETLKISDSTNNPAITSSYEDPPPNETPEEENKRLKSNIRCNMCNKNDIDALFLPCTHHKLCMECAKTLTHCSICGRSIQEKIKTFMSNRMQIPEQVKPEQMLAFIDGCFLQNISETVSFKTAHQRTCYGTGHQAVLHNRSLIQWSRHNNNRAELWIMLIRSRPCEASLLPVRVPTPQVPGSLQMSS